MMGKIRWGNYFCTACITSCVKMQAVYGGKLSGRLMLSYRGVTGSVRVY
jgi:hypothetical protein